MKSTSGGDCHGLPWERGGAQHPSEEELLGPRSRNQLLMLRVLCQLSPCLRPSFLGEGRRECFGEAARALPGILRFPPPLSVWFCTWEWYGDRAGMGRRSPPADGQRSGARADSFRSAGSL